MSRGIPLEGDHGVHDAKTYPTKHANDIDDSVDAIHHTLGTDPEQAAAGDHTHILADMVITLDDLPAPTSDDLLYIIDAPGTTPVSKKVTVANLFASVNTGVNITYGTGAGAAQNILHRYETFGNAAPFAICIGSTVFDGTVDDVFHWGYNVQNSGAKIVAAEPKLSFSLEANYDTGATNLMEFNLDFTSADGVTTKRPMSYYINRVTYASEWSYVCDDLRIEKTTNDNAFVFIPDGATGHMTRFRYTASGELLQIGADDVTIMASNYYSFGPKALVANQFIVCKTGTVIIGSLTDGLTAGGSLAITQDLAHRGTKAGFFNHAVASQHAHIADAVGGTEITTINHILSVLEDYGLLAAA